MTKFTPKKGVVHAVFKCDDCPMVYTHYKTAQKNAAKHAKQAGHVVRGEVANYFVYGEK